MEECKMSGTPKIKFINLIPYALFLSNIIPHLGSVSIKIDDI